MKKNMNNNLIRLGVSTALVGAALAGCTGNVAPTASASAAKAQLALQNGKAGKAVRHAEAAVLAAPRVAETRVLLGNAYLEDGRFRSAATAFADAVELGDASSRTVISLALAQIANGNRIAAIETLERWETAIDPVDLGLALALAGEPERGVHVLGNAIRGGQNNAKARQNLAYSYAMAGQWREARLMAAQDIAAGELGERMAEWGALAHPANSRLRVAQLLGVEISTDTGQPAMLALSNHPTIGDLAAEALAAAAASPSFVPASELPPLSSGEPAALNASGSAVASSRLADAGTIVGGTLFVRGEVVQPLPAAATRQSAPSRTASAAIRRADSSAPAPRPQFALGKGDYSIQLGSYFTLADAQAAWARFQRDYSELRDAERTITKARVKGKIYYRVAATGYAHSSARAICSSVKGRGGGCFAYASGSPLPGALGGGNVRVAAR